MATYKDTGVRPESPGRTPGRMGRIMNSQMNVSLPFDLHERLRELAWEYRQPLSHLVRGLIEVGLEAHERDRKENADNSADETTRAV